VRISCCAQGDVLVPGKGGGLPPMAPGRFDPAYDMRILSITR
jgi:hypothetical protein